MATATEVKCACESCSCMVDTAAGIQKDGKYYCSDVCANGHPNGEGCGHAGCNCHS